jgi:hypothetical protein
MDRRANAVMPRAVGYTITARGAPETMASQVTWQLHTPV